MSVPGHFYLGDCRNYDSFDFCDLYDRGFPFTIQNVQKCLWRTFCIFGVLLDW